jgi:glycosyltransferase involved in cell wall biosynthesis
MPVLSIITINFNNAEGLRNTIDSVINQSFQDFEYLVIDGGSTDGSFEIINRTNRINIKVSEKDDGIYDAMNKGILKSTGDYLLFLNSGDLLCEDVLEKVFCKMYHQDILYGNMKINWGNDHKTIGIMPKCLSLEHMVKDTLWHPVSFIKKELFDRFGMYNTNYKIVADYDFFFKAIIANKVSYIHLDLTIAEYNTGGISSIAINKVKEKNERLSVLNSYLSPEELNQTKLFLVEKSESNFIKSLKHFKNLFNK